MAQRRQHTGTAGGGGGSSMPKRQRQKRHALGRTQNKTQKTANPFTHWLGAGQNAPAHRPKGENAVPLDPAATRLLWRMASEVPTIRTAMRESQDLLCGTPFQVVLGTLDARRGPKGKDAVGPRVRLLPLHKNVRERVIERYWMPCLRDMDLWLRLYGIVPWHFRKLKGSGESTGATEPVFETNVPQVPAFGTGQIETYTRNGEQFFQWRWLDTANLTRKRTSMVDGSVFFIRDKNPPDIAGHYHSDYAALLPDYLLLTEMREAMSAGLVQARAPLRVVEWSPDIAKATGTGAQYSEGAPLHAFGQTQFPSEMGHHQHRPPAPLEQAQNMRSGNGRALTAEADYMPPDALGGLVTSLAGTYAIKAESATRLLGVSIAERQAMLHKNPELRAHLINPHLYLSGANSGGSGHPGALPPNTTVLEPYERMVTHATPTPDLQHLMAIQNRFDQMAAVLSDYPLEMIMSMGGKGGGGSGGIGQNGGAGSGGQAGPQKMPQSSGMHKFVIARQRARSKFFAREVRHIFMMAYAMTLAQAHAEGQALFVRLTGRVPSEREALALEADLDVHVFFPRTPLLTFDEMIVYYQNGLFSEEDFRNFALDVIGMEERVPTAEYKKAMRMMHRDPIDLQLQQMRVDIANAKQEAVLAKKESEEGPAPAAKASASKPAAKGKKRARSGTGEGQGGAKKKKAKTQK